MPSSFNRLIAGVYRNALRQSVPTFARRLDAVADGRITPALDRISIGSGRKVSAAVIFFDIRRFTELTNSDDAQTLKRTLFMLNCTIPAMMRVLYRYDAYVEKNTGDGLMAILGVETSDLVTANHALDVASEMMWALHCLVNPILEENDIEPIDARIGVDMGDLLIARIGVPKGSAEHDRSTLTAVGPAANRACKLQGLAGTNEIWCGDAIRRLAHNSRQHQFVDVTPANWAWHYGSNPAARYSCWRFTGRLHDPFSTLLTEKLY